MAALVIVEATMFKSKYKKPVTPAKHIAIESLDTEAAEQQIALLSEFLKSNEITNKHISFPFFNGPVSAYSDHHDPKKGNEYLTGLWLALDQMDNIKTVSAPLKAGETLLSTGGLVNTFLFLSRQLGDLNDARNFLKWLEHLHYNVCKVPRPDLTIILTHPHLEGHDFAVLCSQLLPNTKLIQHSEDVSTTHNVVWELVRRIAFKPASQT